MHTVSLASLHQEFVQVLTTEALLADIENPAVT